LRWTRQHTQLSHSALNAGGYIKDYFLATQHIQIQQNCAGLTISAGDCMSAKRADSLYFMALAGFRGFAL